MGGLTIEQAKQVIKVAISVNQPILIHGAPGVGKTAFVKALAEELNMKFIDIRPSQTPSEEITGVGNFVVDKNGYKRFEKTLPTIFPTDKDIKAILFIDELTNCQKDVQDVLMSVINERSLGATFYNGEQYRLPDGVAIVAACNDSDTSINANELSQPLKNRFGHIYITNDTTELANGWLKWAKSAGINPAVIGYIEKNKNKIYERDKLDNEEMIYLTPRSWEAVSKILNANQITSGPELENVALCVNAYVNDDNVAVNLVENSLSARGNASGVPEQVIGYLDDNNFSFFFESLLNGIIGLSPKELPEGKITSYYLQDQEPLKRLTCEKRSIDRDVAQKVAFELEQVAFWWEVFWEYDGQWSGFSYKENGPFFYGDSVVCLKIEKKLKAIADQARKSYDVPGTMPYDFIIGALQPFIGLYHNEQNRAKKLFENASMQFVLNNYDDAIKLIDDGLFVRWAWIDGKTDTEQRQENKNEKFKQFLYRFKQIKETAEEDEMKNMMLVAV